MASTSALPIYEVADQIVDGLAAHGRVVLSAPTGSGKSTQVPQILIDRAGVEGEIVVLQPRRLAARLLAKRVAQERGGKLGEEVGYQIRFENVISSRTRIRFVTEAILLRQILEDPSLKGVGAVVFDEFHERHLTSDLSISCALQAVRSVRSDLKLVVMSATLDMEVLKNYLAPCDVLTSEGRTYPVEIEYLPKAVNFESEPVWDVAARECARVAADTDGDMLVFMSGAYEIGRTVEAIQHQRGLREFQCLPLHGELPPEQQDRAVSQSETRKIIVSTNVAETSLTIVGVTVVIDGGLARVARFDANRGINTLLVEKISIASADQRAGRAGRTAPGICVRLWTEREHAQRALQELPEVKRLDLAEVVLTLKASGIDDVAGFPWIEKPDAHALERAELLLTDLSALHGPNRVITEAGRRMLRFPLHPRYARMLLEAQERDCVRPVALMAALTQGRNFLLRGASKQVEQAREDAFGEESESDFLLLLRAWQHADKLSYRIEACRSLGIHAQGARQVGPLFQQFLKIAEKEGLHIGDRGVDEEAVRKCVLAGFSDQVAKRLDGGTLRCALVHERRGMLARESAIQKSPLLVAAEITEVGGRGGEVNTLLNLATAIEEPWLEEMFPEDYQTVRGVVYDEAAKRVVTRNERRFRDLVIESKVAYEEPTADEAVALLSKEVLAGRIKLVEWDEKVERWITRVNRLAEWFPELEVTPIKPEDRATLIEQICYGEMAVKALKRKPVMPVLEEWLRPEQLAVMDDYLPERVDLPCGRRARITYGETGNPMLSARVQDVIGLTDAFTLGVGKLSVRWELLAPNQRPVQITDSLDGFWSGAYRDVRAQLAGRYPKHNWPPVAERN